LFGLTHISLYIFIRARAVCEALNCLLLTPSDRHPLHSLPLTPLLLLLHHITYLPHHYVSSSTVMPFIVALPLFAAVRRHRLHSSGGSIPGRLGQQLSLKPPGHPHGSSHGRHRRGNSVSSVRSSCSLNGAPSGAHQLDGSRPAEGAGSCWGFLTMVVGQLAAAGWLGVRAADATWQALGGMQGVMVLLLLVIIVLQHAAIARLVDLQERVVQLLLEQQQQMHTLALAQTSAV
jgi:hypothetical protein